MSAYWGLRGVVMLFDHCGVCKRCCVVDPGFPPLEVSLTSAESKVMNSICIVSACPNLGPTGCELGETKPLSCSLYPLSYNPKKKKFSIDKECPVASEYINQLSEEGTDASMHLSTMKSKIQEIENSDIKFLKENHRVDVSYFDLQELPIRSSIME